MIEAHPFGFPCPARRCRPSPVQAASPVRSGPPTPAPARPLGGLVLGLALALVLALAACSPPAESLHEGHGIAVEVDAAARTVTLDHEEIPGLMKGMTMTFAVAPEVDLAAVAPGAKVDFRLKSAGSTLTVTEIRPAAP